MGTSTNGQICHGVAFEEDFEFPWDAEHDGDIDSWWLYGVHGFKHSFEIYDANGNHLNGKQPSAEDISRYFKESREFVDANPLPVTLVNYCSGDYPMYAIAVPRTVINAFRGDPTEFDPAALTVTDAERDALLSFCADHGIEVPSEPKWLLTSYWG